MVVYERDERLLNFLSPAILTTIGLLLLGLGAWSLAALNMVLPILPADETVATIIANLVGQIVVTAVTLLLLVPLLRVKSVEHRPLTLVRTLATVPAFCLAFGVSMSLALLFLILFEPLGIPIVPSYGAIELSAEQLANPLNLVVLIATVTVGASVSEELLFRRTLIPSLETRGMAPFAAVFSSSLGFCLVHMPNDIINGSLGYVVTHFVTTLAIGIVLGLSYVITRNVLFPVILHGAINLVSFGGTILDTVGNLGLLLAYSLGILAIWINGIIVGAIALWQALKTPPAPWAAVLHIKSKTNVLPGLLGYLGVAGLLVLVQVLGEFVLVILLAPNSFMILVTVCLFYLLVFALLLGLLTQTRYESVSAVKPESPTT